MLQITATDLSVSVAQLIISDKTIKGEKYYQKQKKVTCSFQYMYHLHASSNIYIIYSSRYISWRHWISLDHCSNIKGEKLKAEKSFREKHNTKYSKINSK